MILGSLDHSAPYDTLSPHFAAAFKWLREQKLESLPIGRINVTGPEGDDVHALVQDNATKPEANCKWEAHRKYADIQLVVTGTERMGYGDLAHFAETTPFDVSRDVAFFAAKPNAVLSVSVVGPKMFTIFLPQDVHMPLIAGPTNVGEVVRKVVMKVRVS